MTQSRRRTLIVFVVALLAGVGAGLSLGVFEEDEDLPDPAQTSVAGETTGTPTEPRVKNDAKRLDALGEPDLPRTEDDPQGLEPGPSGPAPESSDEVAAAQAARDYVEVIDARRGRTLCNAFEPADIKLQELLDVPEKRVTCAASFDASFGFEGEDGQPVWRSSEMTDDVSAQVDGDQARVVATVFTEYSDVREPTIEDDIIYLSKATGEWLVIKPSTTLYRAIGIADIPIEALQPPG